MSDADRLLRRRRSLAYVPVLKTKDGKWMRLKDVLRLWGYKASAARQSAFYGTVRNFPDIPPAPSIS